MNGVVGVYSCCQPQLQLLNSHMPSTPFNNRFKNWNPVPACYCKVPTLVSKFLLVWTELFHSPAYFLFTTEAPSLKEAEGKEPELFLSRSRPVAAKAKQAHLTTLKHIQAPWWKKLGEEADEIDVPKDELSVELGTLFIGGTKPP